jgi:small subunit ribosomal protein S24e
MEVKILSEKTNQLLKRKEIQFQVEHEKPGNTSTRIEVKRAVADALKANFDLVFIRKFETKTGTHTAFGAANLYDSIEQAKRVEPAYIVRRNVPEESKEEKKA